MEIIGGIIFITLGIAMLYWTIKYPASKTDTAMLDYRGLISGLFAIMLGIYLLI
jgi:hypothetical protein